MFIWTTITTIITSPLYCYECTATTTPITPTPADCDVICAFSAKRLSDKCRVLHLCKKKSFPVGSQMERAFQIENYLKKWNTLMQKYSSFLGFTEFVGKITVPFAFLFRWEMRRNSPSTGRSSDTVKWYTHSSRLIRNCHRPLKCLCPEHSLTFHRQNYKVTVPLNRS